MNASHTPSRTTTVLTATAARTSGDRGRSRAISTPRRAGDAHPSTARTRFRSCGPWACPVAAACPSGALLIDAEQALTPALCTKHSCTLDPSPVCHQPKQGDRVLTVFGLFRQRRGPRLARHGVLSWHGCIRRCAGADEERYSAVRLARRWAGCADVAARVRSRSRCRRARHQRRVSSATARVQPPVSCTSYAAPGTDCAASGRG